MLTIGPWGWLALGLYTAFAMSYAFVVLPFDAPDEPAHYEYAWLISTLGHPPDLSEADQLRAQIGRHVGPFEGQIRARGPSGGSIGFGSLGALERQPPTYYLVPAAAARLVAGDVFRELRAMRLATALLSLGIVLVAVLVCRALMSTEPFAARAVPLFVALTPGFLFSSATTNNDALAALNGAAAFGGLVVLATSDPGRRWMPVVAVPLLLALTAKRTGLVALPGILASLWTIGTLRSRLSRSQLLLVVAVSVSLILIVPMLAFGGTGRAAGWQLARHDDESRHPGGWLGGWSLRVAPAAGGRLEQTVSGNLIPQAGPLTAGVWVRSEDDRGAAALIALAQGDRRVVTSTQLGSGWEFLTVTLDVLPGRDVSVALNAIEGGPVRFDGVVLAPGARAGEPAFDDSDGSMGTWGRTPFVNLLDNGSGEFAGAQLRPEVRQILGKLGVSEAALPAMSQLGQVRLLGGQELGRRLRHSFHAYVGLFGWTTLPMSILAYLIAAGLLCLALLGLFFRAVTRRGLGGWVGLLAALFAVGGLSVAVLPYLLGLPGSEGFQGRYLYPAILPLSVLLGLGIGFFVSRAHARTAAIAVALVGAALNLSALAGLYRYGFG